MPAKTKLTKLTLLKQPVELKACAGHALIGFYQRWNTLMLVFDDVFTSIEYSDGDGDPDDAGWRFCAPHSARFDLAELVMLANLGVIGKEEAEAHVAAVEAAHKQIREDRERKEWERLKAKFGA